MLEIGNSTANFDARPPAEPSFRRATGLLRQSGPIVVTFAMLLAPAWWNGFPLLQYDTGGYIARWYEGYLVPSRSTTFGLFLKASEVLDFWPAVAVQSALTVWVLTISLRVFGVSGCPWCRVAIIGVLSLVTSLPWLTSILLTDIFAGLGVLSLYMIVMRADDLRHAEKVGLFVLTAFSTATHSATFAVLLALLGAGLLAAMLVRAVVPPRGLIQGGAAIALGAVMLLMTNLAFYGQFAWTPGGYGIAFGRMLQDGIVARYLKDHCPRAELKLCPYRNELPATADEFLWGHGVFNRLGRFDGLGDEMRLIVVRSIHEYPWMQFDAAVRATLRQLTLNATGEGVHDQLWHTYGIIERFLSSKKPAMRAARQQHEGLDFALVNRVHVPVAMGSMILTLLVIGRSLRRRRFDDISILATTTALAVMANAFVCGALSGPHDRYGARIAWIATLVVAVAFMRGLRQNEPKPFSPTERQTAYAPAKTGPTRRRSSSRE